MCNIEDPPYLCYDGDVGVSIRLHLNFTEFSCWLICVYSHIELSQPSTLDEFTLVAATGVFIPTRPNRAH